MNLAPNNATETSDGLDVREYLRPLWRRKFLIVLIVVVAGAATYFLSSSRTKQYHTSTDLYIQVAYPTISPSVGSASASPVYGPTAAQLSDVAQLVLSSQIRAAVETALGTTVAQAGSAVAAPSATSDFVVITGSSPKPKLAADIANEYAAQFLLYRKNLLVSQARAAITAAQTTLRSLPRDPRNLTDVAERQNVVATIEGYEQDVLNPQIGASQTAPATVPGVPFSPEPKRDTIFAVVIGLVLAILVAYALELLNTKLTSPDELERVYGRPIIATLPKVSNPTPFEGDSSVVPNEFREALRMLRFQLRLNPTLGGEPKTILVTSGMQGAGKSTTVRNLALIYASSGQRVLVVDADLRKPSVAAAFGGSPRGGLDEVLMGETPLAEAVTDVSSGVGIAAPSEALPSNGSVHILVPGPRAINSVDLLASRVMHDLIDAAKEEYDVVLIDSAPLLLVADSSPLLHRVDSLLIVARLGNVTKQQARRVTEIIDRLGSKNFTGVIANCLESRRDYGYGYGYGYGPELKSTDTRQIQPRDVDTPVPAASDGVGE